MVQSDVPSFLIELCLGRLRWDLIHPFPTCPEAEREEADAAVKELAAYLRKHVDPEEVDRTRELPDAIVGDLGAAGYLAQAADPADGGRGLSTFGVFRTVHTAASWSMPLAQVMAVQAAIGVNALLPAVPEGPLREHLRERVAAGVLSGSADTEPDGAANRARGTTAVLTDDGSAYMLTGEKVYVGNGPLAGTVIVSATVPDGAEGARRLFVVDTDAPGVVARGRQEFMGLRGFPIGTIGLEHVRVPREHVLEESSDAGPRLTPELLKLVVTGRMYLIVAPALALTRRALEWMRDFAYGRVIDGRPLVKYEAVAHDMACAAADVFLVDTLARWCLLAGPDVNPLPERMAAKTVAAVTCWRSVDRAMAMLAGEGFETASSKAARGLAPVPLERAFRDARALRISGGVDDLLDLWSSTIHTMPAHRAAGATESEADELDVSWCAEVSLSAHNREHLGEIARQAAAFGKVVRRLVRDRSTEEVATDQRRLITLNRVLNELLSAALVLARAAAPDAGPDSPEDVDRLADVACTTARTRLADHWRQFAEQAVPAHHAVTERWVHDAAPVSLGDDLVEVRV